jgi:hypothetical protein
MFNKPHEETQINVKIEEPQADSPEFAEFRQQLLSTYQGPQSLHVLSKKAARKEI